MKAFEEKYTAWIDGRLEGAALSAFEQELARRAAATEAQADKADAAQLRKLLRHNLQAPVLTNSEFFSLQIRERIEAERAATRPAPSERAAWLGWFATPVTRLVGLGAAALFVVAALYYGMMPPRNNSASDTVARTSPAKPAEANVEVATATAPLAERRAGSNLMVLNDTPTPSPAPEDNIDDESPGFSAVVPDPAATHTTAVPLHYKNSNVNVLWINGLDYMPTVPDGQPASPPAASPASAPADPHHG
jgi:hypothetical protein